MSFEDKKEIIRDLITSDGWRRDRRCKKWETYKKTIGDDVYRIQFNVYIASFDKFIPATGFGRSVWQSISSMMYQDMKIESTFDFIVISEDEIEQNQYFERLGI